MPIAQLAKQALSEAEALIQAEAILQALVNEGLCRPDEVEAILDIKAKALAGGVSDRSGGHKPRSLKTRARLKPRRTPLDYSGLEGVWVSYYEVASVYEGKVPVQDRDDIRHDIMIELDRATKRDGKPLPLLRAYRIASLTVALYYRELNRFSTRVCVFSGQPTEPNCKGCQRKSEGKRCVWLATRPVARLDGEILDPEGYRVRLLDTVATDKALDLPDKWYELNEVRQGLPLRLVEIAYKRLEGKPLSDKDRQYLSRYMRSSQLTLF